LLKNDQNSILKGLSQVERRSKVRIKRGERGIWQRRFQEHVIRHD
jgi:putative transposase